MRARHVPARLAKEGPGPCVAVAAIEAAQRLLRAEGVERFRRFPPLLGVERARCEEPAECGCEGLVFRHRHRTRVGHRTGRSALRPRPIVGLLDHVREDEAVAVARDGADEGGLARVVAQGPAQGPYGLAQGPVRDHHVAPDRVEDLPALDDFAPPLDEQHQQVEVARDQRHLAAAPDERATGGREDEIAERVPRLALRDRHRGNARTGPRRAR